MDGWQVVGDPFAVLGDLRLYHVSFTGLTAALFDTVPLRDLGVLSDGSVLPPESLSADALAAFVEDVETEREHSQYMFAFEAGTDSDGESDYASPHFSRLSLQLTYLIP